MIIELLYKEIGNLFGDLSNVDYIMKCLPDAELVQTSLEEEPAFAMKNVDMVYLGPMSESGQEMAIDRLRPHKERLSKMIDDGTVFLFTGNAMEIMGDYIENEDGSRIDGLGIFPLHAVRNLSKRHNSVFQGIFMGEDVMGFKSQFSMAFPKDDSHGFIKKKKGVGINKKNGFEGYRYKNFFGSYLLGPLLIINPPLARYLLSLVTGEEKPALAFEAAVKAAYDQRLKDFNNNVR